jgi:hypothetical protein
MLPSVQSIPRRDDQCAVSDGADEGEQDRAGSGQRVSGVAKELRDHLHGPFSAVLSIAARIKPAVALLTGMGPSNMRTDPGGILIEMPPPRLRDHMPDGYIGACHG